MPVGAFIPLLLALLVLQIHRSYLPPEGLSLPALAGALVVGWAMAAEAVARVLTSRGSRAALQRWELAAQGMCLGLFLWLCREQGWAGWAPGWSVALLPWLLMQVALWFTLAPALTAATGNRWTRSGLVLHHLRFELAPILIVLPVLDLCEWVGQHLGTLSWFAGADGLLLSLLGGWLLVLALLGVLPAILAVLWGVRPLPDGELSRQLHNDCARAGLPGLRLRMWRSPGGSVHNAVAIGLFPGLRWVLVSDDLLRDLPPDQVRAVVGHEVGHHRYRHIMAYLWFALAANLGIWGALSILLGTADAHGEPLSIPFGVGEALQPGLVFRLPGIGAVPSDVVLGLVLAAMVVVAWRFLFGILSRACEREADLAGANTAGPASMAGALQAVAHLSGMPEDAPSWRHRPIRERVRFLRALARDPGLARLHHRFVRDMRLSIIAIFALLAALGASLWFNPMREMMSHPDPAALITDWAGRAPTLDTALRAADLGDTGPLITWLTRAPARERQQLAVLHLRLAERSGGVGADGKQLPPDDRSPWRLRHRLAALATVPMEDQTGLGLAIDNLYAYGLVAGTPEPGQQELAQAKAVLPRLTQAMERQPSHEVLDTIGCVHFRLADWEAARKAWDAALIELARDRSLPAANRAANESLYRRRLADAMHNVAVAAGSAQGPLRPLHLTFGY